MTLLVVGGWLWAAVLLCAVAIVIAWAWPRSKIERRALPAIAGVVLCVYLLIFAVLPELALARLLPGTRGLSPCDESPGSGCSACTASARDAGTSEAACHEAPPTAWATALGGLGPLSRQRALASCGHDVRWLLRAAGLPFERDR